MTILQTNTGSYNDNIVLDPGKYPAKCVGISAATELVWPVKDELRKEFPDMKTPEMIETVRAEIESGKRAPQITNKYGNKEDVIQDIFVFEFDVYKLSDDEKHIELLYPGIRKKTKNRKMWGKGKMTSLTPNILAALTRKKVLDFHLKSDIDTSEYIGKFCMLDIETGGDQERQFNYISSIVEYRGTTDEADTDPVFSTPK